MPTKRMRILADELNDLISKMEMGEDSLDTGDTPPPAPTIDDWLHVAQDAYNMRRHREKVFGDSQLFGEPTWDILLDLFIAELRDIKMQTTSVCIGAQVPQTTALRWLTLLEKEDLVRRYRDNGDSRRVYVQLTERALKKMVQIFYDRCVVVAHKKSYNRPKLNRLSPGTREYDEAREAILNDTVAQIKIRRFQQNSEATVK